MSLDLSNVSAAAEGRSVTGAAPGAAIAGRLRQREEDLLDLWVALGAAGPTFESSNAGPPAEARERYLVPLARALVGALRGSDDHRAVYLDERTRYAPEVADQAEQSALWAELLGAELPAIAALCTSLEPGGVLAALEELHRDLVHPPEPVARILFVGDCLFVETRAYLAPLASSRHRAVVSKHAFFSASQRLDAPNEAILDLVQQHQPDLIGLSLFTFEGIPPYQAAWQEAALPVLGRRSLRHVDGMVDLLRRTVDDIRSVSDCTVVVHSPGGVPLDRYRKRLKALRPHSRSQRRLLGALGDRIADLCDSSVNVIHLDESRWLDSSTSIRSAASPAFDEDDVPPGYSHSSRFGSMVAQEYDSIVADWLTVGRAKAVLVDFDNTLWTGVMGDGSVEHDLRAQRALLELRNSGVVLVALSKNDPGTIRWDEMLLKESDFAVLKINWRPKPDNVAEAVHELDLAPSAFVLLDDNPVERALVTETVPGVRSLDPGDESTWVTMRRWLSFPSTTQTEEARRRTEMYREAAGRRAAMNVSHDYEAMMASLKLRYTLRPATASDLPRLTELIQRTNQFNTTTVRRSVAQIEDLLSSPDVGVHVASLKDRFGDLGVVAVAVFARGTSTFDSVVMSCRAMGFGLERAVVSGVLEAEGITAGGGDAFGRFAPTERNGPASRLFADNGFVEVEPGLWRLPSDAVRPEVPAWLE